MSEYELDELIDLIMEVNEDQIISFEWYEELSNYIQLLYDLIYWSI